MPRVPGPPHQGRSQSKESSEGDTLLEVLESQKEEFISSHALTLFPSSVRELSRGGGAMAVAVRHASPRLRGARAGSDA